MLDTLAISNLHKNGRRVTPAKKKFLIILDEAQSPLTATEILGQLNINKTTLYRMIETLKESEMISEIDFGDGKKRYERKTKIHHHHLVCIRCKSVKEYSIEDNLDKVEKALSIHMQFTHVRHKLEFFGVCNSCISP